MSFARQASKRYIDTACRCHGLSGSCSMRTCVRRLPVLHDVGRRLRTRFDDAVQVTVSNDDGRRLHPAAAAYSDEDLVYSHDSPDYCRPVTFKQWRLYFTPGRATSFYLAEELWLSKISIIFIISAQTN